MLLDVVLLMLLVCMLPYVPCVTRMLTVCYSFVSGVLLVVPPTGANCVTVTLLSRDRFVQILSQKSAKKNSDN